MRASAFASQRFVGLAAITRAGSLPATPGISEQHQEPVPNASEALAACGYLDLLSLARNLAIAVTSASDSGDFATTWNPIQTSHSSPTFKPPCA
jgi:hypothetical protein